MTFKKIIHRFQNGNQPFGDSDDLIQNDFSSSWGLTYDSHPGPISAAITDSVTLNRSLFVFVYYRENALTQRTIALLSHNQVAEEIRKKFIFLPLDVTTHEGLFFANYVQFTSLPIIALIRPQGNSLEESQIFIKNEGKIDLSLILSYINIEHNENHENAEIVNGYSG